MRLLFTRLRSAHVRVCVVCAHITHTLTKKTRVRAESGEELLLRSPGRVAQTFGGKDEEGATEKAAFPKMSEGDFLKGSAKHTEQLFQEEDARAARGKDHRLTLVQLYC